MHFKLSMQILNVYFLGKANLPRLSSSCSVLDSWALHRKCDNSSGIVHTPTKADGHIRKSDIYSLNHINNDKNIYNQTKIVVASTFECLFFLPHTWQNLQRRQHQFSLFSSDGRSAGSRQNWWKGSQHTWQWSIWMMIFTYEFNEKAL